MGWRRCSLSGNRCSSPRYNPRCYLPRGLDGRPLKYPVKIGREELYRAVSPAELRVVKEFMSEELLFDDGWRNMLILGDSLPALKALPALTCLLPQ